LAPPPPPPPPPPPEDLGGASGRKVSAKSLFLGAVDFGAGIVAVPGTGTCIKCSPHKEGKQNQLIQDSSPG
jgi:hypothetical protein